MKKVLYAVPFLAVASFASQVPTLDDTAVSGATKALSDWGAYIITGIGGIIAVAAGLRLLVKGINRAVGK